MEWQPIKTAPKNGTRFIGCTDRGAIQIIHRNKHLQIWIDDDGREAFRYMGYWMPLPLPPKETQ